MDKLVITLHPRLMRKSLTPREIRRGFHLQQTPSNSGGPLCIWMALMILGVLTRADVRHLYLKPGGPCGEAFAKTLAADLQGDGEQETPQIALTLPKEICYVHRAGVMSDMVDFTLRRLRRNHLVLLYLKPACSPLSRWILAVGVEHTTAKHSHLAILSLDPAEPRPGVVPWNTRLELDSRDRGPAYLGHRAADRPVWRMTCQSAIALSVRKSHADGVALYRRSRP
jgi:hypothetical protein